MEAFEKKVKTVATKIRMRADERRILRERVLSYMEYHPLPASMRFETKARKQIENVPVAVGEHFFYIDFKAWHVRSMLGALSVLLMVGVPFAAERTVPGDVLYPVKVRVNEEVYSQLSLSSYEKLAWETRRVERRVAEARLLAKEGKLTNEAEAEITESVKAHTASAQKELAVLRESNADDAAVAQVVLESAFDVQSAVLDTDHASSTEGEAQIRTLATTVRDAKATLAAGGEDAPSLSSYERFAASVEESTTRAHEFFLAIDSSLKGEERVEIKRRLEDIDRRISAAHALYEASSTGEAIHGLKDALSDTQKLISFMTDIDVRLSVSVETLVPKELTVEERRALVVASRAEIEKALGIITLRMASSTDEEFAEKISVGLSEVDTSLEAIDSGLAPEGVLENAESAVFVADAMIQDLLILSDPLETLSMPSSTPEETMLPVEVGTSTGTSTGVAKEVAPEDTGI